MDGFTVKNANRFLQTSDMGEFKSMKIDKGTTGALSPSQNGTSNNLQGAESFAQTLKSAIGEVNQLQKDSDKAIQNLAAGKTDNIADVMITAEKADIALKLMVQVRNKIIDAYQEVMKMQV